MSNINKIRKFQQNITNVEMKECLDRWTKAVHESVFRSYSILDTVKKMLDRWDSKETIQWIIDEMESE